MDPKKRLLRYLSVASNLEPVIESGSTWVSTETEQSMQQYYVVPTSVRQILFNTGIGNRQDLESLLHNSGITHTFTKLDLDAGETEYPKSSVEILKADPAELNADFGHSTLSPGEFGTVRDLFKLALSAECIEYQEKNGKVMKIEDAVFGIKNALSIADDFMPHEIMGMVEGKFPARPQDFLAENQIGEDASLFILMKESQSGFAGFYGILPAYSLNGNSASFESLLSMLRKVVEGVESSEFYSQFEFSRLLKTLIFQVKSRNQRVLKGPLLSESSLSLLRSEGIIEESGGSVRVKEEFSAEDLAELKERADSGVKAGVNRWFASRTSL